MIMMGYLSLVSTLRDLSRVALVHPHSQDTNLFKPNYEQTSQDILIKIASARKLLFL
jgi:hypothetical protein